MSDPNGILSDIEFENELNELGEDPPALIKFVARQQRGTHKIVVGHGKRIKTLESRDRKVFGAIGGVGAGIGAAVYTLVEFVIRRG